MQKWEEVSEFISAHFSPRSRGHSPKPQDDPVYLCLELIYCLHPDMSVARRVLLEAASELFVSVLPNQARLPVPTRHPFKARMSPWELFQVTILRVSEHWEKDQEGRSPQKTPWYKPTASVMLTRYIKFLAFRTMLYPDSVPMAIALGCYLYTYTRAVVCNFWETVTEPDDKEWRTNLHRFDKTLPKCIAERFARVGQWRGQSLELKSDLDSHERSLIERSMAAFTPWETDHFVTDNSTPLIERLHAIQECERKHALLCTDCAGLERLVPQWNAWFPTSSQERLPTPIDMLRVPMFPENPSEPGRWDDHFKPPRTDNELEEIRLSLIDGLRSSSRRRRAGRFQQFRVCIDDQEQVRFAPGAHTLPPFRVSAGALCVQVFGQDADGELPLAVFYLPDLEAGDTAQRLALVLESGATIELIVAPVGEHGEDVMDTQVTLQLWEEGTLIPETVKTAADISTPWESIVRWISPPWSPQWVGEPITAAGAIEEEAHIFYLDDGDITISCRWTAADQKTPASLYVSWRANLHTPSDIRLRFLREDTVTPLIEVQLGSLLVGEDTFDSNVLGFDPSQERWAVAIVLREPPA